MGRRDTRELNSRLIVLMVHFLKWIYQPAKQSRSWKCTIQEQRKRLLDLFEENPSLKYEFSERLINTYNHAVLDARKETGLGKDAFPAVCPFTLEELFEKEI